MAKIRKLSKASAPRKALLRNQVTALIWNGKITTTETRAKAVKAEAEKLIAKAVRVYDKNVTVTKTVFDDKGNKVEKEFTVDSAEKLAESHDTSCHISMTSRWQREIRNPSTITRSVRMRTGIL